MNYPEFKHIYDFPGDSRFEFLVEKLLPEWSLYFHDSGKYVCVFVDNPKVFFTTIHLTDVVYILEKYMGHKWMVETELMEKVK
jgi:signal recognition particle receptor subunit beta